MTDEAREEQRRYEGINGDIDVIWCHWSVVGGTKKKIKITLPSYYGLGAAFTPTDPRTAPQGVQGVQLHPNRELKLS